MLAHLFKIESFATADRQKGYWIGAAGGGPLVDPVRRDVKCNSQFLDGQGLLIAVRVWAHGSPGHGKDLEPVAAQNRAKGPGRAEMSVISTIPPFSSEWHGKRFHQNDIRENFRFLSREVLLGHIGPSDRAPSLEAPFDTSCCTVSVTCRICFGCQLEPEARVIAIKR